MNKPFIISLDGPAGSGKSTTAGKVAERLRFVYLDSGAMYRAVTWLALQRGVDLQDAGAVEQVARDATIEFRDADGRQLIFVNGRDISDEIRMPHVTDAIAPIAANPLVRKVLVQKQQALAAKGRVVAEGRDMGTVVFPHADLKIFLIAPAEVRAKRRLQELAQRGIEAAFDDIYRALLTRDYNDSTREHSPLRRADDAIDIDTGELTIDEQVERVVRLAKERMNRCVS